MKETIAALWRSYNVIFISESVLSGLIGYDRVAHSTRYWAIPRIWLCMENDDGEAMMYVVMVTSTSIEVMSLSYTWEMLRRESLSRPTTIYR